MSTLNTKMISYVPAHNACPSFPCISIRLFKVVSMPQLYLPQLSPALTEEMDSFGIEGEREFREDVEFNIVK